MVRSRSRLLVLVVTAGVMVATGWGGGPGARAGQRCQGQGRGGAELSALAEQGSTHEQTSRASRTGSRLRRIVTEAQELQLLAMGGEIVEGQRSPGASAIPRPRAERYRARRRRPCGSCARTTSRRRARASCTSRRARRRARRRRRADAVRERHGPGTAFVLARTMSRSSTRASTCSTGTCSRSPAQAEPRSGSRSTRAGGDRQRLAVARGRHPDDRHAGLQVRLPRRYSTRSRPTRASRRSRQSTQRSPRSSPLPNKTNGYQRKAQATIGSATARPRSPRSS